jgi:phage-related protein
MPDKEALQHKLVVNFFRTERGVEPVRQWLRNCAPEVRHLIGQGLFELQLTGHLGMPLCEKLTDDLWELRITYQNVRYRILFSYWESQGNKGVLLLNGFIKKTRTIPKREMDLAKKRLALMKALL